MASLATLRLGVGARLGVTIGATTIPTQTQVDAWLLEAAYKIIDKADDKYLDKNLTYTESTLADTLFTIDISGYTRHARTVGLSINLDPTSTNKAVKAYEVPAKHMMHHSAAQNPDPFYTGDYESPLYGIQGDTIWVDPPSNHATCSYLHTWIQYPADASGMDDMWANLMMDYATMMAELQDEELVDAQIFGQIFDKNWSSYRGL